MTLYFNSRWDRLLQGQDRWTLCAFDCRTPPTWPEYLADQRKYWDADSPDQGRFRLYFGETDTEATFLEKTRERYASFVDYYDYWHGLCRVGETVHAVLIEPNVIGLYKDVRSVGGTPNMEIWLNVEIGFFFRRIRYFAELYKFGSVVAVAEAVGDKMGKPLVTNTVSHRCGREPGMCETVSLDDRGRIRIGDAMFRLERSG